MWYWLFFFIVGIFLFWWYRFVFFVVRFCIVGVWNVVGFKFNVYIKFSWSCEYEGYGRVIKMDWKFILLFDFDVKVSYDKFLLREWIFFV